MWTVIRNNCWWPSYQNVFCLSRGHICQSLSTVYLTIALPASRVKHRSSVWQGALRKYIWSSGRSFRLRKWLCSKPILHYGLIIHARTTEAFVANNVSPDAPCRYPGNLSPPCILHQRWMASSRPGNRRISHCVYSPYIRCQSLGV